MTTFKYEVRGHRLFVDVPSDGAYSQHVFFFTISAQTFEGRRIISKYLFFEGDPEQMSDAITASVVANLETFESTIGTPRKGHYTSLETTRAVSDVIQHGAPTKLSVAYHHDSKIAFVTLRARQHGYIQIVKTTLVIEKYRHDPHLDVDGVVYGGGQPPKAIWGDPWKVGF